jgi:predicted TIM-barrel fold metal-dependent hydrolase
MVLALFAMGCSSTTAPAQVSVAPSAPAISHHQHLVSPPTAALWSLADPFDADDLIAQLDEAGIRRAVVLSVAYVYGDDRRQFTDEYARVRAENDWTAAEVARWPERLVGFCGANPLRPYALQEIERCSRLPPMIGIKLHFGNSGVSLRNPEHLARIVELFQIANARRLPIVVHMRARGGTPYGREDAEILLNQVLPHAPDSVVQIAHLAGAGPGYPDYADAAMAVLSNAVAARDRRTNNLYFDITTVVTSDITPENAALIAQRIREVGADRVLFGADLALGSNPAPRGAWAVFRGKVPLTADEFRIIAANIAPYLR